MNTDNLIRLLTLTKDNKSQVVQELRKAIADYVNKTERYISQIEMDNLQLTIALLDETNLSEHRKKLIMKVFDSLKK